MKTNELTTEKVMNLVEYYEDSAYLRFKFATSKCNDPGENIEMFKKALDIADQELIGYEFIRVENYGDYYRAIWHKIS
jgi:hypothetical protein